MSTILKALERVEEERREQAADGDLPSPAGAAPPGDRAAPKASSTSRTATTSPTS